MDTPYNREGDKVLGGRYRVLRQVSAGLGDAKVRIGVAGSCRYCDCDDPSRFAKTAHAFPEALGNKWVISVDECDDCNARFATYDDALTKAVSPFLTLGGMPGKGNKVRQTGRTKGRSTIRHEQGVTGRRIAIETTVADLGRAITINPEDGSIRATIPVAGVPFKPRQAYKALSKIGFALLPENELRNYGSLRTWLGNPADDLEFGALDVAISVGSVGNAPRLMSAALLIRVDPCDVVPHMLLVFTAGSVCFQIDLMSDHLEDHIPPVPMGLINISWNAAIAGEEGVAPLRIPYGAPTHFNWTAREDNPQPLKELILEFSPRTTEGSLTPIWHP